MFPFTEQKNGNNVVVREFDADVDPQELVWHRDNENRTVQVWNDSDWQFQFEDELPIDLKKNVYFTIPKGVYHRVIKGTTELKVVITKHF